jgi:phosphatidylinositol alpha-1,6-mannosyltransferase
MRIAILLEERFQRLPDGRVFSPSGFGNEIWSRYVEVFGPVTVIARVEAANAVGSSATEITLPDVEITAIAHYLGPIGFVRHLPKVLTTFLRAVRGVDAMVVRAPGTLAVLAVVALWLRRRPFAVEVVGDPVDVFGAGIGGRFAPILRIAFACNLSWLCMQADGVGYVTRETLQRRYPARSGAMSIAISDVEVPRSVFASSPRRHFDRNDLTVFCAASLEVPYKGIDVILDALSRMPAPPRLRIAGDGRLRAELEAYAVHLGLHDCVTFLGRLSRAEVLDEMRRCDVYAQPSLTEGLPRAVIEAMATAAPVIGSDVGGIPELLRQDDMVPPGNAEALAMLLEAVLENTERLSAMSVHSLATARDYEASLLKDRRRRFYAALLAKAGKVVR